MESYGFLHFFLDDLRFTFRNLVEQRAGKDQSQPVNASELGDRLRYDCSLPTLTEKLLTSIVAVFLPDSRHPLLVPAPCPVLLVMTRKKKTRGPYSENRKLMKLWWQKGPNRLIPFISALM